MTIKTMHFFPCFFNEYKLFLSLFEFGENGIEINLDNFEYLVAGLA